MKYSHLMGFEPATFRLAAECLNHQPAARPDLWRIILQYQETDEHILNIPSYFLHWDFFHQIPNFGILEYPAVRAIDVFERWGLSINFASII
jgi:hypothetical protein